MTPAAVRLAYSAVWVSGRSPTTVITVGPESMDGMKGRSCSAMGIVSTPSSACNTQMPAGEVVSSAITSLVESDQGRPPAHGPAREPPLGVPGVCSPGPVYCGRSESERAGRRRVGVDHVFVGVVDDLRVPHDDLFAGVDAGVDHH